MSRVVPRVTVVVPTYRRLQLLRGALDSLQNQTYPGFTAFVCDNADDPQVRAHVAGLDERFRYFGRTENLGIFHNAIAGFAASTTEFVMELDDDDLLEPDCLQRLLEPFDRHADLALSFGGIRLIDMNGRPTDATDATGPYPPARTLRAGLHRPFSTIAARGLIYMVAALMRRDCLDWSAIPPQVGTSYDRYLALRAAENGRAAYYVDDVLAALRIHPEADGSLRYVAQLEGSIWAMESALAVRAAHDERARAALRSEIALSRVMQVRRSISSGYRDEARHAALALLANPRYCVAAVRAGCGAAGRRLPVSSS